MLQPATPSPPNSQIPGGSLALEQSSHLHISVRESESHIDPVGQRTQLKGTGPHKTPCRPCGAAQGLFGGVRHRPEVSMRVKGLNADLLEGSIK